MTENIEWLNKISKELSNRDKNLLERAVDCLYGNIISGNNCVWKDKKIIIPSKEKYIGAWNWDSAFHALAIMNWDDELAFIQCELFLDRQDERGMFPDAVLSGGTIYDTITKPPILPYVLEQIHKKNPNCFDCGYVYEKLKRNEKFFCKYRKKGGMFHYDSFLKDSYYEVDCKNESGWDNSVRWDEGAQNIWAIDLNCYMVLFYRALSYFAAVNADDKTVWEEKERDLIQRINAVLWDLEEKSYIDYNFENNRFTGVLSPASFMPLTIGIADKERAEYMFEKAKSEKFYPLMPTVSYDNSRYSSSDYWRGPTWLNIWYFAIKGLENYGYLDLASDFKEKMLNMCDSEKEGIFEYYDSRKGVGLGAKNFGWSAAFIILSIMDKNSVDY